MQHAEREPPEASGVFVAIAISTPTYSTAADGGGGSTKFYSTTTTNDWVWKMEKRRLKNVPPSVCLSFSAAAEEMPSDGS